MKKKIYAYDTFGIGHTVYSDHDRDMKTMSKDIKKDYKKGF